MGHRRLPTAFLVAASLLAGSAPAWPEERAEVRAEESYARWLFTIERRKEVRPVTDTAYQRDCGECHLAYQPGLLPARSWEVLLSREALGRHFGVNAEIDAGVLRGLRAYALANAADQSYSKRSRKIAVSTSAGPVPLRISGLRVVARAHAHIPAPRAAANPAVKTMAACDACHTQAAQGIYGGDTVRLPEPPR
jgi:cytochrome c553